MNIMKLMNEERERYMRRKMKKVLAFTLTILFFVSSIFGQEIFVSAENAETSEFQETDLKETQLEGISTEESSENFTEEIQDIQNTGCPETEPAKEPEISQERTYVTYEPASLPEGICRAKATTVKGVLPDNAVMRVAVLKEGTEGYNTASEALKASNVQYDGFTALDISFFDGAGNIIEPEAGSVQVQVEMNTSMIAEEADTNTLAVQHLDETEGIVKVEMIADAGAVSVDDKTVKADFSVESFSSFTITWKVGTNNRTGDIDIKLYAATRTEGNSQFIELFGNESIGSLTTEVNQNEVLFPDNPDPVIYGDKTYTATGKAYISYNGQYIETEKLCLKEISDADYTFYVVYAEGEGLSEPTRSTYRDADNVLFYGRLKKGDNNWRDYNYPNKVYLEYNTALDPEEPSGPSTEVRVDSLNHTKYVTDNGDGTYDLTLSVQGASGSSEQPKLVDVLLILDQSGSMKYNMDGSETRNVSYKDSRWYNAKAAINELINSLEANTNIDVNYNLVTFSGSKSDSDSKENDARVLIPGGWQKAENFVLSESLNPTGSTSYTDGNGILDFEPSGGTNYQAGLREGNRQLALARTSAQKVVIFLSDGEATYYYNSEGITVGAGSADGDSVNRDGSVNNQGSCSNAAYSEASTITNANFFYTIGLGDENAINLDVLRTLSEKVSEASAGCITNTDNAPFMCGSLEALKNAFAAMVGDITEFHCQNVTITDNLSENVVIVGSGGEESEVQGSDFRIEVEDGEGHSVAVPEGIGAHYDTDKRQVVLDFPDDYELVKDYVYKVTFTVCPSETAYQTYAQNGDYTDIGEEGTGSTSEGQKGFFSNNGANVTYTYREEERSESYKNPVIQIEPARITIAKKVTGELPEETKDARVYEFKIENDGSISDYSKYLLKGTDGTIEGDSVFLEDGQSATFICRKNTVFTFSEQIEKAQIDGYDLTVSSEGVVSGVASEDGLNLEITNHYQKSNCILTVEKQVSGNMGDTKREFRFTLKVTTKDGQPYVAAIPGLEQDSKEAGIYYFVLKDKEKVLLELPYSCRYTVSEENMDYDTTIVVNDENTGKKASSYTSELKEDTKLTFKNNKDVITPTGIFHNILPYIIMVVGAIQLLIGFFVMHSRRKRY